MNFNKYIAGAIEHKSIKDLLDDNRCKWIGPDQEGLYNGSCGMLDWMCIDGTPEENGMIYCHNCGRKIEHPVVGEQ